MSVYIKRHVKKDNTEAWYALVKTWDPTQKKEISKHVSRDQAGKTLGIPGHLTYAEACARAEQINAQGKVRYLADRRIKIAERLDKERVEALAFLPALVIEEFERVVLAPKFLGQDVWDPKYKQAVKWRAALTTMRWVKLDPSEWAEKPFLFYNYFLDKKYSPGYVERIIALMNLYGYFYCRKYSKAFAPIPRLKGVLRAKQMNAYSRNPNRRHKSDRITGAELFKAKGNFSEENYNWIFISLWFGLRPEEVDELKNENSTHPYYLETQDDVSILVVYQKKLENTIPTEAERWKRIPILYPEQFEALKLIKRGKFERPLPKTMQRYLGKEHADTYSGRKSFTDLMLGLGQRLEDIHGWMGHTTIERTWKDYKNRRTVHFTKPPKKPA